MHSFVPHVQALGFTTAPLAKEQGGTVEQRLIDAVQYKPLPPEKQTHFSCDAQDPLLPLLLNFRSPFL